MYTRLRMDKDNNIVKDEDGDFIKNEPQVGFSLFSIKFFLSIMCHRFIISRQFMPVIFSVKSKSWKNKICFYFKVELLLEDIGDDWENLSSSEEEIKRKPR